MVNNCCAPNCNGNNLRLYSKYKPTFKVKKNWIIPRELNITSINTVYNKYMIDTSICIDHFENKYLNTHSTKNGKLVCIYHKLIYNY